LKRTRSVYGNVFDNETLQRLWKKLTDLKSEVASYKKYLKEEAERMEKKYGQTGC